MLSKKRRWLWLGMSVMLLWFAKAYAESLIMSDGFESSSLSSIWHYSAHPTSTYGRIVTSEARSGNRSYEASTLGDNWRDELTLDKLGEFRIGRDYCIKFSVKPKNWSTNPSWATLFQTHAATSNYNDCRAGQNSVTITGNNGKMGVNANRVFETGAVGGAALAGVNAVYSEPMNLNQWYDVTIRFRPAKNNSGLIRVWFGDRNVYNQYDSPNMDLKDTCGVNTLNYVYAKFGIYRQKEDRGNQYAYYDNISIVENPASCTGYGADGGGGGSSSGGTSGGSSSGGSSGGQCTVSGQWFDSCSSAEEVVNNWSTCENNNQRWECVEARDAVNYCNNNCSSGGSTGGDSSGGSSGGQCTVSGQWFDSCSSAEEVVNNWSTCENNNQRWECVEARDAVNYCNNNCSSGGSTGGDSSGGSSGGQCTVSGQWFDSCSSAREVVNNWSTCENNNQRWECVEARDALNQCNSNSCFGSSSGGSAASCSVSGEWYNSCASAQNVLTWSTCTGGNWRAECTEAYNARNYCQANGCY